MLAASRRHAIETFSCRARVDDERYAAALLFDADASAHKCRRRILKKSRLYALRAANIYAPY